MEEYEKWYLKFASNISFFEFLQEEFREPNFNIEPYSNEIKILSKGGPWTIEKLSALLRRNPKTFSILEELFQLLRFTNAQLIHFLFDTAVLNSTNINRIMPIIEKNLRYDKTFEKLFTKTAQDYITLNGEEQLRKLLRNKEKYELLIYIFKVAISKYVNLAIRNKELVYKRLSNPHFKDVPDRVARYCIKNLHLNELLKGVKLEEFLKNKRIPIDTKSLHGKYGTIRITRILAKHGFVNADPDFNKHGIKILNTERVPSIKLKSRLAYVTEKSIEGLVKEKEGKLKKFDFILLQDLKPKVVIETNFYSTGGTKIGINQNEYLDLNKIIKKNFKWLTFLWITDGNYWLTKDGKNRMKVVYKQLGNRVMNYNIFDMWLGNNKLFISGR